MNINFIIILYLPLSFILSYFLIIYFKKLNIFNDIPNMRSMHKKKTIKSIGIGFFLLFFIYLITLFHLDIINFKKFTIIIISFLIIFIISVYDDFKNVSPIIKLSFQFLSVIILLFFYLPKIEYFSNLNFYFKIIFFILILVSVVWFLNLYNFMDGLNGFATSQFICFCIFYSLIIIVLDINDKFKFQYLSLSLSVGYLFLNFPKPKSFLGDSGSGFMALMIFLITLEYSVNNIYFVYVSLIAMTIFITDASLTLFYRVINFTPIHIAHNNHAYQKLSKIFNSHTKVTFLLIIVNIFWLLPIAFLLIYIRSNPILFMLLAYLPCISIWYLIKNKNY